MDERELLRQLDMLRPHSDDLRELGSRELQDRLASDARARKLYERLQAMDAKIGAAFHDVEPPDGLQERVLARLSAEVGGGHAVEQPHERPASNANQLAYSATNAVPDDPAQQQSPQFESTQLESTKHPSSKRRMPPRRWVAMVTAAAVAAGILAVAFPPWQHNDTVTSWEDLVTKAMHFYRNEDAQRGRRLSQHAAPARFPISSHVLHGPQTTWRGVEVFHGRPAIAYDLQTSGARATLYVIRDRMPQLPSSPYLQQPFETGGLWAIAWQEPDATYMLVAQGTRQHRDPLSLFLRPQSPIL
ncbi:MAG: hypothetical protein OES79_00370 [Planctomycetota bacterium]|nr:hypothetical protein [Planctomycetota bacterium]